MAGEKYPTDTFHRGGMAHLVERVRPKNSSEILTRVRFPGAARHFFPPLYQSQCSVQTLTVYVWPIVCNSMHSHLRVPSVSKKFVFYAQSTNAVISGRCANVKNPKYWQP